MSYEEENNSKDFQFSLATETMVFSKATNSKVLLRQPNNPRDKGAVNCHLQENLDVG